MALVKKNTTTHSATASTNSSAAAAREAEAQRKKARTLGKQQQAAERIAAATGQLSSRYQRSGIRRRRIKTCGRSDRYWCGRSVRCCSRSPCQALSWSVKPSSGNCKMLN